MIYCAAHPASQEDKVTGPYLQAKEEGGVDTHSRVLIRDQTTYYKGRGQENEGSEQED